MESGWQREPLRGLAAPGASAQARQACALLVSTLDSAKASASYRYSINNLSELLAGTDRYGREADWRASSKSGAAIPSRSGEIRGSFVGLAERQP